MRYISTRNSTKNYDFSHIVLQGLANDGGLFVPNKMPDFSKKRPKSNKLREFASELLMPFIEKDSVITRNDLNEFLIPSLKTFESATQNWQDLTPNLKLLELYHGPTLAFKDTAMQFLGPLFETILSRKGYKITIVAATSGDTGAAAMEAFKNRENIELIVLFPNGRVSEFQRHQMTKTGGKNIHPIAINGSFDDCQDLVKACFADLEMKKKYRFSAVNSINWARIMAQMVYYAWSCHLLGKTSFAVPTGNFGNIIAAYYCKKMGFPVDKLHVATNENDILSRFFNHNDMTIQGVKPTQSPSMDIQISSNFERFLFDINNQDSVSTGAIMRDFRINNKMTIPDDVFSKAQEFFSAEAITDAQALICAQRIFKETGKLVDSHTAIAIQAAQNWQTHHEGKPIVALGTASPIKFTDFVKPIIGDKAQILPEHLTQMMKRPEKYEVLDNNLNDLFGYMAKNL